MPLTLLDAPFNALIHTYTLYFPDGLTCPYPRLTHSPDVTHTRGKHNNTLRTHTHLSNVARIVEDWRAPRLRQLTSICCQLDNPRLTHAVSL